MLNVFGGRLADSTSIFLTVTWNRKCRATGPSSGVRLGVLPKCGAIFSVNRRSGWTIHRWFWATFCNVDQAKQHCKETSNKRCNGSLRGKGDNPKRLYG